MFRDDMQTLGQEHHLQRHLAADTTGLTKLFNNFGGLLFWSNKNNWMTGDPCTNNWYGVTCLDSEVVKLELPSNALIGSAPVPSQLGLLSKLEKLDLSGNGFYGSIPSQLGLLTLLTEAFKLDSSEITGSIPSQLGQLTGLTAFFSLDNNEITGAIPSQLGLLTSITDSFLLESNTLCDDVPAEVTALSSIVSSNWEIQNGNELGSFCCQVIIGQSCPDPTPLPTSSPSTFHPSSAPSFSNFPTLLPTSIPTIQPSPSPSNLPTMLPTSIPTIRPSPSPSNIPTILPTSIPTIQPSPSPSSIPTMLPTLIPTIQPSPSPSLMPTTLPTTIPTIQPSPSPSLLPSPLPTLTPTEYCPSGTYKDPQGCLDCAIGHYSFITNAATTPFPTSCTLCPAGQYNTASGSSNCIECATGKLSSSDRTHCKDCEAGEYNHNDTECVECGPGLYAPQPLTDSCLVCPNGSHTNNQTKATTCTNCDAGKYSFSMTVTCNSCPKGSYSASGAVSCSLCAKGTYSPDMGTASCTACSAGNFSESLGASKCESCGAGKYQGSTGQDKCSDCDAGRYADRDESTSCLSCAVSKDSVAGSTKCELAALGYFLVYDDDDEGTGSIPCPNHALCNGAYSVPIPADNYWVDHSKYKYAGNMFRCPRETCRRQSKNSSCWQIDKFSNASSDCDYDELQCTQGASGPLCGSCENGYVFQGIANNCQECENTQLTGLIIIVCVFAGLASLLLHRFRGELQMHQWQTVRFFSSLERGSLKILWVSYQIIAASSYTVGIEFPAPFSGMLGVLSVFSLDFLALECFSNKNAYFMTVYLWCLLPIVLIILSFAVGCCRWLIHYHKKLKDDFLSTVVNQHIWIFLFITYLVLPPVSSKQLKVFDCIAINNKEYLRADTSIDCNHTSYLQHRNLIVLFLVIYQLIPILWMILLYRQRKELNPSTSSSDPRLALFIRSKNVKLAPLRFLFIDYKCNKWWFEIADMYRRIAFLSIVPLISPNPATRASFGCILAICSVAYFREEKPYRVEFTNVIAHIAQFCILITYYGALTIHTSAMMNFGLQGEKLGIFLLLLNMVIAVLVLILAYTSFVRYQKKLALKEYKAQVNEYALGFSKEKFKTTFEAIWKHSVPSSHTLLFHYTSVKLAQDARKSGVPAQTLFNGVPFTLRQPHIVNGNDFAVFKSPNSLGIKEKGKEEEQGRGTHSFPNEEVLVLSLPKQYLEPLLGYEDDEGLCMISAKVLKALRPSSFTTVMDSHPWFNGITMLPPHCILRSFYIMKESMPFISTGRPSSSPSYLKSSMLKQENIKQALTYVHDDSMLTESSPKSSNKIVSVLNVDMFIDSMRRIRQRGFIHNLVPLFHYTSLNIAPLILQTGLRMSSQGQGDGGVYVSTLGPASYGLGTDDYEFNIIKDCFGVERVEEYLGQGKLEVVIVYACEPYVLQQAPGGRDNAKMVSKSTFTNLTLEDSDGNFFLRPDRILGAFHIDPQNTFPELSPKIKSELEDEIGYEKEVIEKLGVAERKHKSNGLRIDEAANSTWGGRNVSSPHNSIVKFKHFSGEDAPSVSVTVSKYVPSSPALPPPPPTPTGPPTIELTSANRDIESGIVQNKLGISF